MVWANLHASGDPEEHLENFKEVGTFFPCCHWLMILDLCPTCRQAEVAVVINLQTLAQRSAVKHLEAKVHWYIGSIPNLHQYKENW